MKNNYFREIFHNDIHIATIVKPNEANPGLSFVTSDDKFLQLGIWNYQKGHNLPAHYHNQFKRSGYRTNEFVFVLKGAIECILYTEEGDFIESVIISESQGILMFELSHEYKIIEDSIILESKNGPFMGVEKDKTVINVKKAKN